MKEFQFFTRIFLFPIYYLIQRNKFFGYIQKFFSIFNFLIPTLFSLLFIIHFELFQNNILPFGTDNCILPFNNNSSFSLNMFKNNIIKVDNDINKFYNDTTILLTDLNNKVN